MSDERWPVLVTRLLPQPAMDRIAERCEITLWEGEDAMPRDLLLKEVAGKPGAVTLLTDKGDDEFLDAAGDPLLVVAHHAVGFDNTDLEAPTRRAAPGTNTPQVHPPTTAATTWAPLHAAARRVA